MLVFLKLGGSLITDKNTPRTPRPDVVARLMHEIGEACVARPELRVVLGHGSGSFGHVEAKRYGTRQGVRSTDEWMGFAEVQHAASLLNRLVVGAAHAADLPIFNCPPSASAVCHAGVLQAMAVAPLQAALAHSLMPLVGGDVAVDTVWGGTIVSTEDVFRYLAGQLHPAKILLAGRDVGVLTQWPDGTVIPEITAANLEQLTTSLAGAHTADVTGGMASKVREALAMAAQTTTGEVLIFSGETPGLVKAALLDETVDGTRVRA